MSQGGRAVNVSTIPNPYNTPPPGYHVFFFYAFGTFALGFYITNTICHANSLYYLNPYVSMWAA